MGFDAGEVLQGVITIGGGAGALAGLGLWLRRYFKSMGLEEVAQTSVKAGIESNDKIIANMQVEMERLGKRISVLERQVDDLTDKLANVRVVALDCYSIVLELPGIADEARARLVTHLKQIIREA